MAESHRFHHYEVQRDAAGELVELGRGNMGVTYKGFDTSLRCPVALKTLLPTLCSSQKMRERFIREAQATAQVQVDNVLRVTYLAAAPSEPRPFYVMELIAGQTLGSVVKAQGCLAPKDAVAVGLQVTEALIAIHRCGLVHRDIKPENLMRVPLEKGFVVKVIDFGVARWSDGASHSELTFGGFVGTPAFASPEQVRGEPVDIRSDIYSLGATLFYLLTGRLLFDGDGDKDAVIEQQQYMPPPLDQLVGCPEPLVSVLRAMLEKNPKDRPATPDDLKRKLTEVSRHLVLGSSDPGLTEAETVVDTIWESATIADPVAPSRRFSGVERGVSATAGRASGPESGAVPEAAGSAAVSRGRLNAERWPVNAAADAAVRSG